MTHFNERDIQSLMSFIPSVLADNRSALILVITIGDMAVLSDPFYLATIARAL